MINRYDAVKPHDVKDELILLRQALDTCVELIVITDFEGYIQDVNAATLKKHGILRKEDMIGRNALDFVAPEDREKVATSMKKMDGTGYIENVEYRIITADGIKVLVEANGAILQDKHGNPKGSVVIARDISERKKTEVILLEREEKLRSLFDHATDGIFAIDLNGVCTQVNNKLVEMHGLSSPGEMLGQSCLNFVVQADLEMAIADLEGILEKGSVTGVEYNALRADGTSFPCEVNAAVHKDANGNSMGIIGIVRDITERKLSEGAVREAERRYQAIFDNRLQMVYVMNEMGVFIDANDCALERLGYTRDDLGKISMVDILHPDDLPKALEYRSKIEANGYLEHPLEFRAIAKSGETIYVVVFGTPVDQGDGRRLAICIAHDITESKQAEAQLRESEEKLRRYLDSSPDGIYISDAKAIFLYGNRAAERIVGYSSDELIGKSWLELNLLNEEYYEKAAHLLASNIAGMPTGPDEFELIRKDGSRVLVEISTYPIGQGDSVEIIGIARDITERKQMEKALRESEEQYSALVQNIADAVFRFKEGKLTWANNRIEEILGYTKEEMVGVDVDLFMPSDVSLREVYKDVGVALVEQGFFQGQTKARRKDGSIAEIEYTASLIPGREPPEIVGVARDITERKQSEEALLIKDNAIEKSLTAIVITDIQGTITYVNQACLDLWRIAKREDVVGQSFWALLQLDADTAHMVALSMIEHGQWQGELMFSRRNSEQIKVQVLTAMVYDRHGNAIQTITSFIDVTERKKMEQQLLLSGRLAAVGELAAGVAHELNNPLAAVQAFAEFLAAREDLDETTKRDVDTIYKEAQRASRITSNLLSFAREHNAEKSLVSINEVIEKVLEMHSYRMNVSNIETVTELAPDLPRTLADYYQMQQVFTNIITNAEQAMKAVHGKGTLVVKTETSGRMIRITFADDGPGIPEDNLKRLFDPFFTTKEVGEGTGLGLSICYGIMQEHGGRIYAEAKPGRGSTFVVELPVVSADRAEEEVQSV